MNLVIKEFRFMIDIERFICSRMRQFENIPEAKNAFNVMQNALNEQGIIYKDGQLQRLDGSCESGKKEISTIVDTIVDTEFEAKLKELFGITDFAAKDIGKTLMWIARKQIAEEIDVDGMTEKYYAALSFQKLDDFLSTSIRNAYDKGILDTLGQIKKGE